MLALSFHFPSDVIAGYLVAGAWALGAFALIRAREPGHGSRPARRPAGDKALWAVLVVVGGLIAATLEFGLPQPSPLAYAGAAALVAALAAVVLGMVVRTAA